MWFPREALQHNFVVFCNTRSKTLCRHWTTHWLFKRQFEAVRADFGLIPRLNHPDEELIITVSYCENYVHRAKHHICQMPNVLHDTHFIEHWIDQGDWLAAADELRTGLYLFLTLKTTLASLWSVICVSVCAAIWKEKAPVCLEVRSGVQYKCFGSSWTQRRTSGINSSRRKKLFPSALNWQRIRFIQGAGL